MTNYFPTDEIGKRVTENYSSLLTASWPGEGFPPKIIYINFLQGEENIRTHWVSLPPDTETDLPSEQAGVVVKTAQDYLHHQQMMIGNERVDDPGVNNLLVEAVDIKPTTKSLDVHLVPLHEALTGSIATLYSRFDDQRKIIDRHNQIESTLNNLVAASKEFTRTVEKAQNELTPLIMAKLQIPTGFRPDQGSAFKLPELMNLAHEKEDEAGNLLRAKASWLEKVVFTLGQDTDGSKQLLNQLETTVQDKLIKPLEPLIEEMKRPASRPTENLRNDFLIGGLALIFDTHSLFWRQRYGITKFKSQRRQFVHTSLSIIAEDIGDPDVDVQSDSLARLLPPIPTSVLEQIGVSC